MIVIVVTVDNDCSDEKVTVWFDVDGDDKNSDIFVEITDDTTPVRSGGSSGEEVLEAI
jgi:hypothetical protein